MSKLKLTLSSLMLCFLLLAMVSASYAQTSKRGVTRVDVATTITESSSQTVTTGNSIACGNGADTEANSYWRSFDLASFGITTPFNVQSVRIGIEQANTTTGTQSLTVRLYTNTGGTFPSGTRTQIGTATVNVPNQSLTLFDIPVTASAPGSSQLVVEIFSPGFSGVAGTNQFFIGSNSAAQTAPSYLSAPACGINTPTDTATIGFPNFHIVMNVTGNVGAISAGQLIISEFRVRGPNGANDEFIELYNNTDTPLTVATVDGSSGFAVVASNGVARFVVPNGTVIPARGHYLGVNSVGYSLASYPAGNGSTATGDATFTTDIPDNAGIAVFNTATAANFTLANRLDAVGSTSEANTLYKEGTGYPALTPFSIDYSFYRDMKTAPGFPKDTDNNAADFLFVDTNGTSAGAGQRLGAPGPENLSSPIYRPTGVPASLIDPLVAQSGAPNRVRDFTSDPANNSTFGTLSLRRTFTNNTGANVTRLRFRIVDITTFPAPSGTADLRPRTSTAVVVTTMMGNVTAQGTTLEQPPSQPNGGGFNSTLSAGTVTLATPLPPGGTISVQLLLGIQQTGSFRILLNTERLP